MNNITEIHIAADKIPLRENLKSSFMLVGRGQSDGGLFVTADNVRDTSYDVVPPIIENVLLVGATLVHGPAKKGKSWLTLQMGHCADTGQPFLGCEVRRNDVLYVGAEDTAVRFKSRLQKMSAAGQMKLMTREKLVEFAEQARQLLGPEGMTAEAAFELLWHRAGRPKVNILDTQEVYETTLGITHGKHGDSVTRRDYLATSTYDRLAQKLGIAIVLVGHWGEIKSIQKATINPHECLNTTKARLAGVTTSITLGPLPNQEPGENTREMQLSIRSRDLPMGDQALWVVQDEMTGKYKCLGSVRDVLVTEAQRELFGVLMDARKEHGPEHWMTADQIGEELGKSGQAVKQMIGRVRNAAKIRGHKAMYQGMTLESKQKFGYRLA